jgi:hypothetical protein
LCKEAGLLEPVFDLGEGFKITIWRPEVIRKAAKNSESAQATDQATGQAAGQVTGQATDQVTDQVNELIKRLILISDQASSRQELMNILQLKHNSNFRDNYLNPAMDEGFIEMTIPDKPNSPNQKYRLTEKGQLAKTKLEQDE